MAHGYSTDLRERAVGYVLKGGDRSLACDIFRIGSATLQRWISQYKKKGSLRAKPNGSRPWKLDHEAVLEHIKAHDDSTLHEIAHHFDTVPSVIDYICRKHKITRKKNHSIYGEKRRRQEKVPG